MGKQIEYTRNKNSRRFDYSAKSGSRRNHVKINPQNSLTHEPAKFLKCYELSRDGHEFITEASFGNKKGIADIVDLDDGVVFEILDSETEESIGSKRTYYPLTIEPIRAGDYLESRLGLV